MAPASRNAAGHRPGHRPGRRAMSTLGALALEADPERWVVHLSRMLRERGVPCTVAESTAACRALAALDIADAMDVHLGLRSVFVSGREQLTAFDDCFRSVWHGVDPGEPEGGGASGAHQPASDLERLGSRREERRASQTEERIVDEGTSGGESRSDGFPGTELGATYSAAERLARRSFASLSGPEVREMNRVLDRLRISLATRQSRRLRAGGRRGPVDLRRSLRAAAHTEGEILRLARRSRRIERARLVLLCDVSGSMERYSGFLVRFLLSASRGRDVETFVFSTRLTRVSPWLRGVRAREALDGLGERVHDWSGGTRIGACLTRFVEEFGRSLLGPKCVVVIMSDGLDRGEIGPLTWAMQAMRRRARRVIWLNPLLESPDYRPEARGMKAALPFVDDFVSGHSVAALRELAGLIRI